ncbi:MAG TPA: tripartite tricarboxylate transporter substrate binding protein [Burkholderiales bacterium]|jgi:tripartite-type tricarboxylate transporter receptor subunit TctC
MKLSHFLLGAAALFASAAACAQGTYPNKSIRLVIPSTPGGGTDFIGRTLAQKLAESTGWTVVAENRPGAAGTLGLSEVAHAAPDGYELVIGQTASMSLAPWLMKLNFDPVKDLTPVASAVDSPQVLLVSGESPYKTWADFVKAAKASAAKPLAFGTSGIGSVAQIIGVKLQETSGFTLQHVPYKGSAPAIADLLGGHVDLAGTSLTSGFGMMKSNRARALVVTSAQRAAAFPDVPTMKELGYAEASKSEWLGVLGPKGLPAAIADRLHTEINKVLAKPEVRTAIQAQGQDPRILTRAEFATMVRTDNETSRDIIKKAGIKLE